jgi:hypothetical protein
VAGNPGLWDEPAGRGIDLHPGLVIIGVLAGGELAGVAGMFLSVPVIAGGRIVWRGLVTSEKRPVHDRTTAEPAQKRESRRRQTELLSGYC